MTPEDEQAIARDLSLCDLGLALTTGAARQVFIDQRRACFQAIREANAADGLDQLSSAELLALLNE